MAYRVPKRPRNLEIVRHQLVAISASGIVPVAPSFSRLHQQCRRRFSPIALGINSQSCKPKAESLPRAARATKVHDRCRLRSRHLSDLLPTGLEWGAYLTASTDNAGFDAGTTAIAPVASAITVTSFRNRSQAQRDSLVQTQAGAVEPEREGSRP
jgi:hypothetical protein